ncbi:MULTISPECIES: KilA-N domain-containing protein [Klebsiella/Raoultella group]|uniref:KilA-N domain-containing protein n=1 Tax=Klebsiella/Raoultella group TaxID=2890311 RepID=UPI001F4053FF|nr:KilA-N domain-containing protein [Klebsiella pneumoniae]MDR4713279.1 KilA-N domain-containing protein [Klebsiella pneumoniae]
MEKPTTGRFNLNALHRASSGDNRKRPSLWLANKQAQELITELSRNSGLGQEVIKTQKGGTTPGTFAHELLAIEYAGWISPRFSTSTSSPKHRRFLGKRRLNF